MGLFPTINVLCPSRYIGTPYPYLYIIKKAGKKLNWAKTKIWWLFSAHNCYRYKKGKMILSCPSMFLYESEVFYLPKQLDMGENAVVTCWFLFITLKILNIPTLKRWRHFLVGASHGARRTIWLCSSHFRLLRITYIKASTENAAKAFGHLTWQAI